MVQVMTYETLFLSPDDILQFNKQLAVILGNVNDAIILNQINYWLKNNKKNNRNYIDGKYWVYNSYSQWAEREFPFWSPDTIKRSIVRLEKAEILESANYNKKVIDKTKWYTINYEKLQEIIDNFTTGQNAPTTGQNAPIINADCPDHEGNLPKPIPDTTTKNSTENTFRDYEYNGAKSEKSDSCTEIDYSFDYEIFERQIRNYCLNKDIDESSTDKYVNILCYFQSAYSREMKRAPYRVSKENMAKIITRLEMGFSDPNGPTDKFDYADDFETYREMIDWYFEHRDVYENPDEVGILHFTTNNVRVNLFYDIYNGRSGEFLPFE